MTINKNFIYKYHAKYKIVKIVLGQKNFGRIRQKRRHKYNVKAAMHERKSNLQKKENKKILSKFWMKIMI